MTLTTEHALDTERIKRIAAEHIAVELGLLIKCFRHGEHFHGRRGGLSGHSYSSLAAHDPVPTLFRGNAYELLAAIEAAADSHGAVFPHCVQ
jgi:hypothetical protein